MRPNHPSPLPTLTASNPHPRIDPSVRLRRAIHLHSLPLTARILRSHPALLQNPDLTPPGLSNTNLHLAALLNDLPITAHLLAAGHEASGISLNNLHQTPLMLAAAAGHVEICHALCAAGEAVAGVARRDARGRDALMLAAEKGFDTCVQILLTFAPAPADADGATPAEALLRAQDLEGNTALHFASANGRLLVLRTLLAAGADPERRNGWSWTAVSYSATVAAEVYFRGLVAEREGVGRARVEEEAKVRAVGEEDMGLSLRGRGLRLVQDD